ncbi:MAG: protease inhibitor I42 family protein [Chloroflexaceae bacterium]|nr:protease inhibitor I42 family protein [Chloroflexaceae bacterium]
MATDAIVRNWWYVIGFILMGGMLAACGGNPPPAPTSLTAADSGRDVTLQVGAELVLTLEGNPTTGYEWQVEQVDAAVLAQQGEPEYTAAATMPGSSGVFVFRFTAQAAGSTPLVLGYSRPFEPDTPPIEEFTVQITVE